MRDLTTANAAAIHNDDRNQPDEPEDDSPRRGREMDPELLRLGRIIRLFEELDAGAQRRVMGYLYARYGGA